MKFTTIIVGAFAACVSAAPAVSSSPAAAPGVEPRSADLTFVNSLNGIGNFNVGDFNNFQFDNPDLGYLFGLQGIDINVIAQLVAQQNLDLRAFGGVFFQQEIDIVSIIALTQLHLITHFSQLGFLSGFDLRSVVLGGGDFFNLGLLQDQFQAINLQAAINPAVVAQVQTIAIQQFNTFNVNGGGIFKE